MLRGTHPVSWLLRKDKPLSAVSSPSAAGIVPVSWLLLGRAASASALVLLCFFLAGSDMFRRQL